MSKEDLANVKALAFLDELSKIGFLAAGGYLNDQVGKSKIRQKSADPPDPSFNVKEGMIPTSPTPMGTTGMQAQKSLMKSQRVGTPDDPNGIKFKPFNQAGPKTNDGPKVPGVPNSSGTGPSISGAKTAARMAKQAFSDSGFGPTGGVFRPQYASYQGQTPIPSPVMMDPNIKQGGNAVPRKKEKVAFSGSGFGPSDQIGAYGGNGGYHESYQGQIPIPPVSVLDPRIKRAGNCGCGTPVSEKKAGIPLTPKGRLASAQREGKPKMTGFSGPSIADVAKPIGYGQELPGAKKDGI